ncbi:hypothetical protein [Peptostreptococcus faecalis]|uniref:hypothetical protein n=1 Tax=Peptostreptococcus faecalis TaxID=2045015 RepID=UPI0011AF149A|nr:hypothetical protein [Peptostreptococcus faecalis]
MAKGFYKANNRTRQLKYTKGDRTTMYVLEAIESLEKYQNIDSIENRGLVSVSIRELQRVIKGRNDIDLAPTTISKYIGVLLEDGDLKVVKDAINQYGKREYFLTSFSDECTAKWTANASSTNGEDDIMRTAKWTAKKCTAKWTAKQTANTSYSKVNSDLSKQQNGQYNKNNNKNNIYSANNEESINSIWKLYPEKKGKINAIKSIGKLLKEYTVEEIEKAIERYKQYVSSKRSTGFELRYQHGSSFFNKGIYDYLGDDIEDTEVVQDSIGKIETVEDTINKNEQIIKY